MTDEEAFHAVLSRLVPHLQEHVRAHCQTDDNAASNGDSPPGWKHTEEVKGAKASGSKGSRKFRKQNKQGSVA